MFPRCCRGDARGMPAGRACCLKLGKNPTNYGIAQGSHCHGQHGRAARSSSAPTKEGSKGLGTALLRMWLLGMWDGEGGGERKTVLLVGTWDLSRELHGSSSTAGGGQPGGDRSLAAAAWGCPKMDQQSHSQILARARAPDPLGMGRHPNICLGVSPEKPSLVLQKRKPYCISPGQSAFRSEATPRASSTQCRHRSTLRSSKTYAFQA